MMKREEAAEGPLQTTSAGNAANTVTGKNCQIRGLADVASDEFHIFSLSLLEEGMSFPYQLNELLPL